MSCQQFIENDAQAIDVRLWRDLQALNLFWSNVCGRANYGSSRCDSGLIAEIFGNSKVR